MEGKKSSAGGTRRLTKPSGGKRLSLYPLPFEVAIGAALKTGPAPKAEKAKKTAKGDKA